MNKKLKFTLILLVSCLITLIIIPYFLGIIKDNNTPKNTYLTLYNKSDGHIGAIAAKDTFIQPFLLGEKKELKSIFITFKTFNRINIDTLIIGYKEAKTNNLFTIDTIFTKDLKDNSPKEIKLKKERTIQLNDAFFITSLSGKHPNIVTFNSMTNSPSHHYLKNNIPVQGYISHILTTQELSRTLGFGSIKKFIFLQICFTVALIYWFFLKKQEK